ncbi:hypothetical protein ACJMK2_038640, partial [Sinanodonta woodiana]
MELVHLILFLLAISVQGIMAMYPCNKIITDNNGTVLPEEIPSNVTNCTFSFNVTSDNLMLVFSSLGSLFKGDSISIKAESKEITNITSGNDPVTVVSTSSITVVTFLRGLAKNGTFKLDFKNACEQDVHPSSEYLVSPRYLPQTKKTIVCKYNVMNQEGQTTLLEFTNFTLNSSSLTVNGTNVTAGNMQLPDDLLLPINTTITLSIPNTEKAVEGFSLILSSVSSDCSYRTFNMSNPFSYTKSSAAVCHLMIGGSKGTLLAAVNSWQTDISDQLLFRDGHSKEDSVLDTGSPVESGIIIVSSGSLMSVHLTFSSMSKERNVNISFTSQVYGGLVEAGDSIKYNSAESEGKDGVFQCIVDADKKISLTNFNMTNNGKVEVYQRNVITDTPLFTITNTSLPIPVFVTNQVMIVAKYSSSNYTFTANTGEARDSDQFSQHGLGSYQVVSSGQNDSYTYNLIILPMPNRDSYRGTLQLTRPTLCPGDKVTIFEGITTITDLKKLVEFTSNITWPFIPQYIFAADKGAWITTVLSKCDGRKTGDVVFTASYDVKTLDFLCGKSPSNPIGTVTSPYYPLRYPLNLNCKWTFQNETDSFLYITVAKLDITDGNSLKLTGNISEFSFPADKTLGRDLIFNKSKELMLSFSTESKNETFFIPGDGFTINYNYLDCGGSFNADFNASLGGAKNDCRWIVSLPNSTKDNNTYIINATLRVTTNYVPG